MKIKHTGGPWEECTAADLRHGDAVLVKYYDTAGEYVEETWAVLHVKPRRYGRGYRYTVKWRDADGKTCEDSYPARRVFGRRVTA